MGGNDVYNNWTVLYTHNAHFSTSMSSYRVFLLKLCTADGSNLERLRVRVLFPLFWFESLIYCSCYLNFCLFLAFCRHSMKGMENLDPLWNTGNTRAYYF